MIISVKSATSSRSDLSRRECAQSATGDTFEFAEYALLAH